MPSPEREITMGKRTSHSQRKLRKRAAREERLRRHAASAHPVASSLQTAPEDDAALRKHRQRIDEAADAVIKLHFETFRRLADM